MSAEFNYDGCTLFPDGWWAQPCCWAHDVAYWVQDVTRWQADNDLAICVAGTAAVVGPIVGAIMWLGVRLFGWLPWRRTRRSRR